MREQLAAVGEQLRTDQLLEDRCAQVETQPRAEHGVDLVVGHPQPPDPQAGSITMGRLLDTCKKVSKSDATFTWVDPAFLEKEKVQPWADMPAWSPAEGDEAAFGRVSAAKAKAAGLKYRPLDATVRDTLAWFKTEPPAHQAKLKAGISAEREVEVLKDWHARAAQ